MVVVPPDESPGDLPGLKTAVNQYSCVRLAEVKTFNEGKMAVEKYNVVVALPAGTPYAKPEYNDRPLM